MKRALVLIVEVAHITDAEELQTYVVPAIREYADAVEAGSRGNRSYDILECAGVRVTAISGAGDD